MATSQIASMLDELMGRNRNVAPNENVRELQWSDPEVCRLYVVQFCPHDLFTNTKADLGPCGKIHDDELRRRFQEEKEGAGSGGSSGGSSYKKGQYVEEFLRFCQRMLTELQVRIKKAKERLHLTQNEEFLLPASASGQHKEVEEKIQLLSQRMTALVEEAEKAGCEGNVEQAQGLMKLSDQLREEREQLRRTIMPFYKEEYSAQQKAMEVCDTCGAFLIVGDAQQRIDDHLMGKQHIGYARLRAAVELIVEERRKVREERDREMDERRKRRDDGGKVDGDRGGRRRREDVDPPPPPSTTRQRRDRSRDRNHPGRSRSGDRHHGGGGSRGERRRSRSRERRRSSRDGGRDGSGRSSRHRSRSPRDSGGGDGRRRSGSGSRHGSSSRRSRSRDIKRRRSKSRERSNLKSGGGGTNNEAEGRAAGSPVASVENGGSQS